MVDVFSSRLWTQEHVNLRRSKFPNSGNTCNCKVKICECVREWCGVNECVHVNLCFSVLHDRADESRKSRFYCTLMKWGGV